MMKRKGRAGKIVGIEYPAEESASGVVWGREREREREMPRERERREGWVGGRAVSVAPRASRGRKKRGSPGRGARTPSHSPQAPPPPPPAPKRTAKGTPIVVYKKHGKAGGWRGHARTHAHTPGGGARSLCVRGHHPPVPAAAPTKIPAGWVPTPGRRPPPPDRRRSASVVAISLFSCSHLTLALPISLLTPPPLAAHRRVHCLPQPPLPAVPGEGRGVRSMCVCVCV